MYLLKIILPAIFAISSYGALANCNIKNSQELFNIIKEGHPEIKYNESLEKAYSETLNISSQLPNPEFEASREEGKSLEGDTSVTSLALSFPIELGGKRSARKIYAINSTNMNKQILRLSSEDAYIKAILIAYRLRQVYELLPIYKEALDSLNKILKIKLKRKSLSPEEEVEKETLGLATNDYRLKISRLKSEREKISRELSLSMGRDCRISRGSLPLDVDLTKDFSDKNDFEKSAQLLQAKESLNAARAKLELEKSQAFPDMKIGPTLEVERVRGRDYKSYGISVSIGLPVFNLNSGGRKKASRELHSSELNHKHVKRHVMIELESEIEKYNTFRESLKTIASRDELEKKHMRIEKLFKRGVISTSMIIESHRQLIEFASTRFEFELGAVEAIWNINKIKGAVFSSKI